MKHKCQ